MVQISDMESPEKVGIKYIIRVQEVLSNLKEDHEKNVDFFSLRVVHVTKKILL